MYRIFNIVFLIFSLVLQLDAQIATNSPYSRFGLGELEQNIFPHFNALGGASTAFNNSSIINADNPATYSSFNSNSFLLSTGGWNQITSIQNKNSNQVVNNNAFSYLVVGFPLSSKIGASFGLVPFSSTGYEIVTRNVEYNADINYYGDGGLSRVYFGGSYQLSSSFSFGINASYLFGGINRRKNLVYDDESFLHSRSSSKINLKGYYYQLGLLYKGEPYENDELSIGITANNNSSIRAKKNELIESFTFSGLSENPRDTFLNYTQWGDVILPQYISAGILYEKAKEWLFVFDYSMQNWSDYTIFDESDNLANSIELCGGVQYTPEHNSLTKYYKRMDYRIGASYSNTPLQFGGSQLKEISLSFGFGIPVKKSRTKYDFSCALGQRGTTDNNLIQEQFIRLALSVSYDGIWFVKRKYD